MAQSKIQVSTNVKQAAKQVVNGYGTLDKAFAKVGERNLHFVQTCADEGVKRSLMNGILSEAGADAKCIQRFKSWCSENKISKAEDGSIKTSKEGKVVHTAPGEAKAGKKAAKQPTGPAGEAGDGKAESVGDSIATVERAMRLLLETLRGQTAVPEGLDTVGELLPWLQAQFVKAVEKKAA